MRRVNSLARFEDWVSGNLEDRLGSLLGARLQPVDLARRLGEALNDRRAVGAGRTYVPNAYRLYLAPMTFAAFASFQAALQEELAAFLVARAAEERVHFVGRPRVQILVDEALKPERLRVEADLVDRSHGGPEAIQSTQAIDLGSAAPVVQAYEFLTDGDRPVALDGELVRLGRALDNEVILDHATVSRHHAMLSRRGSYWVLQDLGSTHGSFVNGHRITTSLLRAGDEVRLGSAVLRLRRQSEDHDPGGQH